MISVVQLTAKGNKVMFTKEYCLLLGPSANMNQGDIIGKKGKVNLYRLKDKLTMSRKHQVLNASMDLQKKDQNTWKLVAKKNGPRIAPTIDNKKNHEVLNHAHNRIVSWFREEYPEAMAHMETMTIAHDHNSCPPCTQGKTNRHHSTRRTKTDTLSWTQYLRTQRAH